MLGAGDARIPQGDGVEAAGVRERADRRGRAARSAAVGPDGRCLVSQALGGRPDGDCVAAAGRYADSGRGAIGCAGISAQGDVAVGAR